LKAVFIVLLLCASAASAQEKPKILVLDLQAAGGTGADVAAAFGEAIAEEIDRRGYYDSLSSADMRTILGVERQRQLMGCSETDCQAELAGALGARFALTGTLAKLGEVFQLTLQTVDTQKAQTLSRSTRIAKSVEALREQLPWSVAEATGAPLPPTPTNVVPYAMLGGGALVLAAGGVVGIQAMTQENIFVSELRDTPDAPRKLSFYEEQNRTIGTMKTVSLGAMVVGAALIGSGAYLYRRANGSVSVALVPTSDGFAFAGVLP
jgi:hypothetical protein